MKEKVLIMYHNDLDGLASAAIAAEYCNRHNQSPFTRPYTYGEDTLDDDKLASDYSKIYILDMCLRPFTRMLELAKKTSVVWIDHHINSINEFTSLKLPLVPFEYCLGDDKNMKSACELCWGYFFGGPAAIGIKEISRVDTWHHNDDTNTWAYFEWADYTLRYPYSEGWKGVFKATSEQSKHYQACVEEGRKLRQYREFKEKIHAKDNAMEVEFEGYKCIALNSNSLGSSQFNEVYNADKHKMMIRFSRARGYWKFSIYTTHEDIDLSLIANKYGGGGHKAASGFEVHSDVLPFKLG